MTEQTLRTSMVDDAVRPSVRISPAVAVARPIDRLILVYVVAASTLLLAHLAGWRTGIDAREAAQRVVWLHLAVAAAALAAPRLRASDWQLLRIFGDWYPLILMQLLYIAVGLLNRGVGDGYAFDAMVRGWDQTIFGHEVAYDWIRSSPEKMLSWVLHFCYLIYFPLLGVGPIILQCRGRLQCAQRAILATTTAFFACYIVFLLFPVAGPSYHFPVPDNSAALVWPARAARSLFFRGDAWGSAFPSAHVATSLVATIFAVRAWRPLAWITVPPTLGIMGAVVYSQIHYGADALAGIALAVAVTIAVLVWDRRSSVCPEMVCGHGAIEVAAEPTA